MAVTVRCTSIFVSDTGQRFLRFDDGSEMEFQDLDSLQAFGNAIDAPGALETARRMLVRHWLLQDADASETSLIVNKTLSFDMGEAPYIQVS